MRGYGAQNKFKLLLSVTGFVQMKVRVLRNEVICGKELVSQLLISGPQESVKSVIFLGDVAL